MTSEEEQAKQVRVLTIPPMMIGITFGLIVTAAPFGFATVLTLFLCPVFYSLFFRIGFKGHQWNPQALRLSANAKEGAGKEIL
jgi:hypothetical protein